MMDSAPDSPLSASHGRRKIVVLLVDDQAFVGAAVRLLLASEPDIELHCCLASADAIAFANRIDPTIVLQDLVMPGIDGLTLVQSYRHNPQTADTPVIVLSGNDDDATRARALAAGADGYLVKLPGKADLIACIRQHGSRQPNVVDAPDTLDTVATIDSSVIAGFLDAGAPDFTRMLISQFMQEAGTRVAALREAAASADAHGVKTAAHSLRGSSQIMGASRLGQLCAQVEDQLTPTLRGEVSPVLFASIDQELARVLQAMALAREGIEPR
jgi:CheY-like chemotaxis protein